jgi:hypothetical protein
VTRRRLAAVIRAAGGPPRLPEAASPLGRYLTDPGAVAARVARVLLDAARHPGPVDRPLLATALMTAAAARAWLQRRQHAAHAGTEGRLPQAGGDLLDGKGPPAAQRTAGGYGLTRRNVARSLPRGRIGEGAEQV